LARTKQEVVTEFRCEEILDAARKIFATNGFSETTMEGIAEQAGIAKGTLYLYFKSKRDLYLAALIRGLRLLNEDTHRKMIEANGLREKLSSSIEFRARYFEQNRDFFLIYHSEFSNLLIHPAKYGGEVTEMYLEQARVLSEVLREAIERGEIASVPADLTAFTICDMARSVILQRLLGWSKATLEEDIGHLIDLIWRGISA
jgi:AcrR family transcriptional regulator